MTLKKFLIFNHTFEKNIDEVLFKQNHTKEIKLDLNKVVLEIGGNKSGQVLEVRQS